MINKIPESRYNADPALRQSDFKKFLRSPAIYDQAESGEQKTHFNLGNMVDCLFLEPEKFNSIFREFTETASLTTKAAKAFIKDLKPGQLAYTPQMMEKADTMVTILEGLIELPPPEYRQTSAFTTARGVDIKARCDWYGTDGYIYDLKTASDLKWWSMDAVKYGYDIQSAWYKTCFDEWKPEGFRFIVIDSGGSHDVIYRECSAETEDKAGAKIIAGLEQFKKCTDSGIWTWHDRDITFEQF